MTKYQRKGEIIEAGHTLGDDRYYWTDSQGERKWQEGVTFRAQFTEVPKPKPVEGQYISLTTDEYMEDQAKIANQAAELTRLNKQVRQFKVGLNKLLEQ